MTVAPPVMAALSALILMAAAPAGLDHSRHPSAPDYADTANWMALEDGVTGRKADLFYIHPTTFKSQEWNQDVTDATTNRWTDVSVGARQISAFDKCCRRFAPRYRQASSRAFVAPAAVGDRAYDLAYEDIRAAFRLFIAQHNHGRPFIIAGHSQGALQGLRLLREEVVGTSLAERLVVAYLPGIGIPLNALPPGIEACALPRQTRCIVSWNSFTPDADTQDYVARALARYGKVAEPSPLLCVNPVSFTATRPATRFAEAKGSLPGPAVDGPMPLPWKAVVAARCDGNVLRVTPRDRLPVETLPGGVLHMADIALFWADIADNSNKRVEAATTSRR